MPNPFVFFRGQELVVAAGGQVTVEEGATVVYASGSIKTERAGSEIDGVPTDRHVRTIPKVGATAGWGVGAANNLPYMATLPASQTGSTLVVPIDGLIYGETITGFSVLAQIESAAGAVTLDADLRAVTNVAAEPTDASVGAIAQVSVVADTAVFAEMSRLAEVIQMNKSYYVLITATTAADTDIILLGLAVKTRASTRFERTIGDIGIIDTQ